MRPSEEFDTSRREYRLSTLQKFQYLVLAAICLVGAGFFFKLAIDPVGRDFAAFVGAVALILGLFLALLAFRSRLTLDGSRIELRSALRTFTANRNDIRGLRKVQNQYGSWTRVCLEGDGGAFNVSDSFNGNAELKEWLKGLPDLDERDAAEIQQEVTGQYSRRGTEPERSNAFQRARAWAIGLSIAAGFASIAVLFVNYAPLHTPAVALLVLFPLLGIFLVRRFPLLFTMFKRKIDPRADVGVLTMWPGLAMLLSYKTGGDPTHLVDPFGLTYWALVILVCYVAALSRVARENPSRWAALAGLVLFGGMYSVGMVNATNTVLDHSAAQLYSTRVLRMYETHGRNASSYLRLARWGPLAYDDDVDVPKRIYRQVKLGDQICTGLRPGFLHAPWYTLVPCPVQPSPPEP